MTKKIIKLLIIIAFLHSCKETNTTTTKTSNQVNVDSNLIQNTNYDSIKAESFTLSCGSGCAMIYNEMKRNILGTNVEIKFKVTQYVDEKIQDEYFETYLFDSNSTLELIGVYEKGGEINIIDHDEYVIRDKLIEIGSNLFKKEIKSSKEEIQLVEENQPYKLLILPFDWKNFVQNLPENPNTIYTASSALKQYLKTIDYEGENYDCYFLKNEINNKILLVALSRGESQYYLVIYANEKKINNFQEIGSIGGEEPTYFKIDKDGKIQTK